MVLQEIADSPSPDDENAFAQDEPDFTPTSSFGHGRIHTTDQDYLVNTAALAKPFPFTHGVDFERRPEIASAIGLSLAQARGLVDRPLKQDEVDALAQTFAKSMQFMSYSMPASLLAGGLMAYRGRAEFKVPFLQLSKRSWFDAEKLGPLRGIRARYAWHTIRFAAWQGWCLALAGLFFGSMARTSTMNTLMTDKRLQAVRDARVKAMSTRLPEQRPPRQMTGIETREGRMDAQAVRASEMLKRNRRQDDDMSPTSGAFADEVAQPDRMLSDRDVQMSERRQEQEGERQERAWQQQQTQVQTRSRPQQEPASASSSGGAWERLRQQAASGQKSPTPSSPTRSAAPGSNDYTFSEQFEDKQLAHGEAQRDFDARVDRERRGGDFDAGKKDKGWW